MEAKRTSLQEIYLVDGSSGSRSFLIQILLKADKRFPDLIGLAEIPTQVVANSHDS